MERVEAIVVGAGVVGLAIARALAMSGHEVLILETAKAIGTATSSRNSGVIHAGIYYQPGSLKAKLCVEGRKRLYSYAVEKAIAHKRCGKLIVATDASQIEQLSAFEQVARQNGVTGLRTLTAHEVKEMEPEIFCVAALLSPDTGILDVHQYMYALLGDAEAAGATLALNSPVTGGKVADNGFVLDVDGAMPLRIGCRMLVNAAGLGSQALARRLDGLNPQTIPPQVLAKGNYFSLSGKPPFTRLVYPLPVLGSSGLHATCDLSGQIRFGPDVEWVDQVDYHVDPTRAKMFAEAILRYWPGLPEHALQPDYCGIRPKIARASPHDTDFVIHTQRDHGIAGLVNLYGIESPGLTSSLAIADLVTREAQRD